ncbi:hypothetical protein SNEBB_002222 [Seison nebaliae]|nr:hypothetical protein SNEBB_002222 [Seison nebaliae]
MFLTSNTTSVKLPSISICLTRTREEDSGLIITNVIKYTKNYNCSAEIGEITQSLICASGQFDGLNGNYPEWNNKPKLVDYLDGFFKKLYRNINFRFPSIMNILIFLNIFHRENDWALSMKKKLLLKNYDIHTAIKTVLSIDFKKIEHLSISKLVYENYVNCSIHLEKQGFNLEIIILINNFCSL